MIHGDAFARILASLNDTVSRRNGWMDSCALIDETLRTHGNVLAHCWSNARNGLQFFDASIAFRGERLTELERQYCDEYVHLDKSVPRTMRLPDGRPVHLTEILTEEEIRNSVVYNDFFPRFHALNRFHVRFDGPNGAHVAWTILDPEDGYWSSDRLALLEALVPHVRHFLAVRELLASAAALDTSLSGLLELSDLAVIQLDARGRIFEMNDRARAVLRLGDGLSESAGMLSAMFPKDNRELQQLLARALPVFGRQPAGNSMVLRRRFRPHLALHVKPVSNWEGGLGIRKIAALVLIADPMGQVRTAPQHIASVLGLTPAEAEVAMLLTEGRTPRQIAEESGREYGTVRMHLKNIYSKLGISRQYDLARMVLALANLPARK